jgi:hypothetical protein
MVSCSWILLVLSIKMSSSTYKFDSRQLCESWSDATKLQSITSDTPDTYRKLDTTRTDEKTKIAVQSQPFHAGDKLVEILLGLLILRDGILSTMM